MNIFRHGFFSHSARHFMLLAVIAMTACGNSEEKKGGLELQVISPHGSDIRREFGEAFSRWHESHFGEPVKVVWPDVGGGGTELIVRQLTAAYQHGNDSGYDIVFGGGSATFNRYVTNDFLVKLPLASSDEMKRAGWTVDPVDAVPRDLIETHGKGDVWIAATMSSFGIEINKERIAELAKIDPRMKEPRKWEDLTGAEWFSRLSLADPAKSGSVKTSYEMIFQQNGWEKGWAIMTQLFANTAMVREGGSNPGDDVAGAEAVAGIVIDFYGRLQVMRAGGAIAAFVIPEGGTALDADPIGMLKGAPHAELAARFIRFVASEEGQRLWVYRAGLPGGPRKSALGRMALLPTIYEREGANLSTPENPFAGGGRFLKLNADASRTRNPFIGDLIKAALIDNREALVRARRAIMDHGDRPELLAQLLALPSYRLATSEQGSLAYGPARPLTEAELKELAAEYTPGKEDPRAKYAERIQSDLKDFWRESFARRFADVETLTKPAK